MADKVHQMHLQRQARCASYILDESSVSVHRKHMKRKAKPQWTRTYLREWREFRGKTQEEVAPKMGFESYQQLGKIERGLQPYNQRVLEAAAREYQCSVQDLLTRPPGEADDLFGLWSTFDERQKRSAGRLLRALRDEE
jgi:transcriptional regulator with XRE-family HTH domain